MPILILTHAAAAIIPIICIIGAFFIYRILMNRRLTEDYWKRQSGDALRQIGFWDLEKFPEPPFLISDKESMITGLQTTALVQELGFIDYLYHHPQSNEEELAKQLDISVKPTRALLGVLESAGIVASTKNGYILTDAGRIYAYPKSPFYMPLPQPGLARQLYKQMRKGKMDPATEHWKQGHSNLPEQWGMQQHLYSFPIGFALHQKGFLDNVTKLLDVAGGAGSVCIAVAMSNLDIEIDMIELPVSLKTAQKMMGKYGQTGRINCIGMNMFTEDWPKGYDAILFTNIFHDWSDDDCRVLCQKAYESLKPGGMILIQEALLNEDNAGPLWTEHWSLAMTLFTDGKQFKGSEMIDILDNTGFHDVSIHPLLSYYSSIIGIKSV